MKQLFRFNTKPSRTQNVEMAARKTIGGEEKVTWYNITDTKVIENPTNNCQLISIAGIQYMFNRYMNRVKTKKDKKEAVQYIAAFLTDAVEWYGKFAVLLDVNDAYASIIEDIVKKLPDGEILTKAPYESTNGSKMVIFVIKVVHNDENDDDPYDDDDEFW